MCGICGFINYKGKPADRNILNKMMSILKHRGPDKEKSYVHGSTALGVCCSQTIDLAGAKWPIVNENGTLVLICTGEIYNYLELREELSSRGHRFRTNGHAEVILHLYEERGTDCLSRLRGMFAFIIWDTRRHRLFGARDRFGIKPFYYLHSPRGIAFASEIKALLEIPYYNREVNEHALAHYLTFQYVPDPLTMFVDIYSLPAAHFFVVQGGEIHLERYWQACFFPEPHRPRDYFIEGIQQHLREAVELHTRGHASLGSFLSGGIDSTIIAALLRERGPVKTFSVGYEDNCYSEAAEASETAKFLETQHHEYIITPIDFLDKLPRLIWHFGQPLADPAAISLYFVAQMAASHTIIALSGEGADEVFGGYGIYREPFSLDYYRSLPCILQDSIKTIFRFLPPGIPGKNYIRRASTPLLERYVGNAYIFSPQSKEKLLIQGLANPSPRAITQEYFEIAREWGEVETMQFIDIHTWLPGDILMKVEKIAMANSLELRVPFLDHHVFEFAATLPTYFKIRGQTTKLALREAFRDIVPPPVYRRPKRGFPVPTREWIKKEFAPVLRTLIEEPYTGKWFRQSFLRSLFLEHCNDKADNSRALWTIMIFLLWYNIFFDGSIFSGDSLTAVGGREGQKFYYS